MKQFMTKQAKLLLDALIARSVPAVGEHSDGHKHVDVAIIPAKIYIEVDGLHHVTDPDQIERDFKRDHFSDGDDFHTIHVLNIALEHHLDRIADAIAEVARRRMKTN